MIVLRKMTEGSMRSGTISARWIRWSVSAAVCSALPAMAQDGLAVPRANWLWPQVQARITVQTGAVSPLATTSFVHDASSVAPRGVQAGGLFGDYTFARTGFGNLRASGGLMLGHLGGAPQLSSALGAGLGVAVLDAGTGASAGDEPGTVPYVGLGYSSPAFWSGLSLTAELGMVAGRPGALGGFGRALLGNQAMDLAVREMRLAPVLQFGLRYTF